jgi:tetratricopeptide (TPR) repeat protein
MKKHILPIGTLMLGAALWLSAPPAAHAEGDQSWQACIAKASTPSDRVTACSSVIDAKIETGRKLAVAYCNRGEGLTERLEFDRALADLDEAIRIDPAYACSYANRGRVYAGKGEADRAMTDYNEAIRLDPSFALAFNNRGNAWLVKGDMVHAMADLNTAIKLDPKLAIAYGNRGYLYYRSRDLAHAIADYSTQIKLAPEVLAYINRGNAYRDSEQLDRAAACTRLSQSCADPAVPGRQQGRHGRLRQGVAIRSVRRLLLEQPRPGQDAAWRQARCDCGFQKGARTEPRPRLRARQPSRSRCEVIAPLSRLHHALSRS